jgi:ATP-dependent RNA helicase RhlE
LSFDTLGLSDTLLAQIKNQGYTAPTPIQTAAIPVVLTGRDVIGLAQTGTGKTAAFVLPIIQRLMAGKKGGIRALIITPTRELAEQIHTTVVALSQGSGLRSATVYGGVSMNPQEHALRAGYDIIVACPGRLLDHLTRGYVRLDKVESLVLDEADRMLDMGFLPSIQRILAFLPKQRQTLLFSATMAPEIKGLAHEATNNAETVQVSLSMPATTVSHGIYPISEHSKTALLLELLRRTPTESVLVFTRTKHRANRVAMQLERANYKVARLHSNRSQNQRQIALDGFRDGTFQVLVATDIAARGIDVATISHVINYDIPDTPDAYIHRIGRTGRAARTGDAYTLVTPEDSVMVRTIERVIGHALERRRLEGFEEAPAPQRSEVKPAASFGRPAARPSRPASRERQPQAEQQLSQAGQGRSRERSGFSDRPRSRQDASGRSEQRQQRSFSEPNRSERFERSERAETSSARSERSQGQDRPKRRFAGEPERTHERSQQPARATERSEAAPRSERRPAFERTGPRDRMFDRSGGRSSALDRYEQKRRAEARSRTRQKETI